MITIKSKINHFKATFAHVFEVQQTIVTICYLLQSNPDFIDIVNQIFSHFKNCEMDDIDETIGSLLYSGIHHDESKFGRQEWLHFAKANEGDWLKNSEYGSDEYKAQLKNVLGPGLDHHYASNDHHPEYYGEKGVWIDLIQSRALLEMLCDWYAATKRHKTGNIFKSIRINQERFGYSTEVADLFEKFYMAFATE